MVKCLVVLFIKLLLSSPLLIPVSAHCTGNDSLFAKEEATWAGEAAPSCTTLTRRFATAAAELCAFQETVYEHGPGLPHLVALQRILQSVLAGRRMAKVRLYGFPLSSVCGNVPLIPWTRILACTGREKNLPQWAHFLHFERAWKRFSTPEVKDVGSGCWQYWTGRSSLCENYVLQESKVLLK